jgi:hypothetical protein
MVLNQFRPKEEAETKPKTGQRGVESQIKPWYGDGDEDGRGAFDAYAACNAYGGHAREPPPHSQPVNNTGPPMPAPRVSKAFS